jgi:drug/metabolite transporter (DMT)-like permease
LLATPVVSVLIATFWLGETLTASLAIAIVLILGGVAIGATGDVTSLRVASDPP